MAKTRRGGRRGRRRSPADGPADTSIRSHWRTDGQAKTRYATADAANRAALQHRLEDGADFNPYPCTFCNGWHLASQR